MKQILTTLIIAALLTSCGSGKWVIGDPNRKQLVIKEGKPYAYKDIKYKKLILIPTPNDLDSLTITVKK